MVNKGSIFIPPSISEGRLLKLSRPVCAIQLVPKDDRAKLGPLVSLDVGTEVTLCGEGYNDRTVKVCARDQYYFVFSADLGIQKETNS